MKKNKLAVLDQKPRAGVSSCLHQANVRATFLKFLQLCGFSIKHDDLWHFRRDQIGATPQRHWLPSYYDICGEAAAYVHIPRGFR